MLKKQNQKGFTIIEVLIVLAIAALIMLVVFLAVPALRRNAANSGRANDAAKISSAVTDCLSNHNGIFVGQCDTAALIDINNLAQLTGTGVFQKDSTTAVTSGLPDGLKPTTDTDGAAYAVIGKSKCATDGSNLLIASSNTRDFVVMYNKKTTSSVIPQCIGS